MRKNVGSRNWFNPQPVLIVAAYDENGAANAMNAAWGGVYESDMVVLCLSEGHKTTKNIMLKKAFTVSMGTVDQMVACDYVGMESGNKVPNKMEKAGWTTVKSEFIDAPVINELPLALECELVGTTENGNIIGKIVNTSVDEKYLNAEGKVDLDLLKVIAFDPAGMCYRVVGEKVGKAFADGAALK